MKREVKIALISILLIVFTGFIFSRKTIDSPHETENVQPDEIFTMQIGHGHGVRSIRHSALRVLSLW